MVAVGADDLPVGEPDGEQFPLGGLGDVGDRAGPPGTVDRRRSPTATPPNVVQPVG